MKVFRYCNWNNSSSSSPSGKIFDAHAWKHFDFTPIEGCARGLERCREQRTTRIVFTFTENIISFGDWIFCFFLVENLQPPKNSSSGGGVQLFFFDGGTWSRFDEYIEVSFTCEVKWWKFASCDFWVVVSIFLFSSLLGEIIWLIFFRWVETTNQWFERNKTSGFPPKSKGTFEIFTIHCESEVDMGKIRAAKHGRPFKFYLVVCCGDSRLQIYVPNKFSETKPQMVPIRI